LEYPTIAVRITERGIGSIIATLWSGTWYSSLSSCMVEDPADVVEHVTHLHTPLNKFGTGCFDVVNYEIQALN
jgi:hypothetical protein